MDIEQASEKVERLRLIGERLLKNVDFDEYERWNAGTLRVFDLLFGQSSEPYMSFRFPGGGGSADSRESRVKNAIGQKLKVLNVVQQDLAGNVLRPKFGWNNSESEIDRALSGIEEA